VPRANPQRASNGSGLAEDSSELREANERLLLAGLRERHVAEQAEALASDLEVLLGYERFLRRAYLLFADSRDYRAALRQVEGLELPEPATALSFQLRAEGESGEHGKLLAIARTAAGWQLTVPLAAHGTWLGTIVAGFSRRPGTSEKMLFEQLAERAAISIDNGRLLEETRTAVRVRDELLAVISHDFGSPLGAVRFSADAILIAAKGPAPIALAATTIRLAERQMTAMLGDLVDLAQLHAGKMILRRAPRDLGALVSEVFRLFEGAACQRRIGLVSTGHAPRVQCDRERVIRLLGNLVGNAIKFAPEGTQVDVRLELRPAEARVYVSNEGQIPQGLRARLFEAWSNGGEQAGSGLGLYIAKGIALAHGGEIWVEDGEPGKCTIAFSLPRSP
jgi:signal transduction histidine kinase